MNTTIDGVSVSTRTGTGDLKSCADIVLAVRKRYGAPGSFLLKSVYEDDDCEAGYDIHLVDDLPPLIALILAEDIDQIMKYRERGYNQLTINHRGRVILSSDAWWDENHSPVQEWLAKQLLLRLLPDGDDEPPKPSLRIVN